MKGKLSPERHIRVTNTEKLSKSLLTFVNTLEFFEVFGRRLAKETRNVKYVTTLLCGKLKL